MALFPCAVGSHRYAGPQRSAYLGVANGALSARSKLRLCPSHFQDLSDFCEQTLLLIAVGETTVSDDDWTSPSCAHHPDKDSAYRGYATLYPLKDEARVLAASLCEDCADAFRRVGHIELS